jgi:DNA repair protein RecN (Recombination protein N)
MLKVLQVRDLALIREARLEFGPGLNVLTGETGAGKTVLVEALGLLLGGRGDSGLVSSGADRLELEALFELADNPRLRELLEQEGITLEDNEIIIRRVMSNDGKGRCYINGRLCTVGTLNRVGEYLVDIHGQHEHQRLLRTSSHLEYLDDYGPEGHAALLKRYEDLWRRWNQSREALRSVSMEESERLREIDLLRYQIKEIEAVKPAEGEMEDLLRERKRMQNREELFSAARDAYLTLMGEEDREGAVGLLGMAESLLERGSSLDEEMSAWTARIRELQEDLSDLSHELRSYLEGLDFEPGRLEEVESRLRAIGDLARKYGPDTREIMEHLERARRRLEELENLDSLKDDLEKKTASMEKELREVALGLSKKRKSLAERLARETNRELEELNMAGMRFRVLLEREENFSSRGLDRVSFEVSPGEGLPFRPISHIASGGELSRIMLALKLCLAKADAIPTLVFDEVDAGIGGTTADVLAEKLQRISHYHQVFSITHLPAIAARSDSHMSVSKRETAQGIVTEVEILG